MGSATAAESSSLNRCCPNAVKGAGAREGDLSRCSRGFACLIDPRRSTAPQTGTLEGSPEQDLSRRNGVGNQNTTICNNMMHDHGMNM